MTIEKSLARIESMLCELIEIAREQDGESTASVEPRGSLKRVRTNCGTSHDEADSNSTSDGIDLNSGSSMQPAYMLSLTNVRYRR